MFTVSKGNFRHAYQKSLKHFISRVVIDILNNMEELNSELHCYYYYYIITVYSKRKWLKFSYIKMFCFSPITNKEDWHGHFYIKRFSAPSFFACTQVMLNRKLIWHSLNSTSTVFLVIICFSTSSINAKKKFLRCGPPSSHVCDFLMIVFSHST